MVNSKNLMLIVGLVFFLALSNVSASSISQRTIGNPDAPVILENYCDFQNEFCLFWYEEIFPEIKEDFVDEGFVKILFRHFPLNSQGNSMNASISAECAGEQNKFFEYIELLYDNQGELNETSFEIYAEELNLNSSEFNDCRISPRTREIVEKDIEYGENRGVGGTPTFFVQRCEKISGAQPYHVFESLLEEALEEGDDFCEDDENYEDSYCPQEDGFVGEVPDENMHDAGPNGGGDTLEIYCRENVVRLCLSEEDCAWREDIESKDESTCMAAYESEPMATSANEEGINIAEILGIGNARIEEIYCNDGEDGYFPGWEADYGEWDDEDEDPVCDVTTCTYDEQCLPFGHRVFTENNESKYCEFRELKIQKEDGEFCQNNYECFSNMCNSGECVNLEERMDETENLLYKIIDLIKNLFR